MSAGNFQNKDDTTIENLTKKRDFSKFHQQQAAHLNDSDKIIVFLPWENNNCHQIGNADQQFDIDSWKWW